MRTPLLAVAFLVACGGNGTEPEPSHVLRTGTYSYSFSGTYGLRDYVFQGTLTLTYATEDSVAGTWNVQTISGTGAPGFKPEIRLGFWNISDYVLGAAYEEIGQSGLAIESGTINHRVTLTDGTITCDPAGWILWFGTEQGTLPHPATCTLTGPS